MEWKINRRLFLQRQVRLIFFFVIAIGGLFSASPQVLAEEHISPESSQHQQSVWILPPPSFPADNPYTESKAELGKIIFFDPRLTHNKNFSCVSCHNPGLAWADGMDQSVIDGRHTMPRHTPSLINVAYRKNLFWDGRATTLEGAISEHLQSIYPDRQELIEEIIEIPGYRKRFSSAFGNAQISLATISASLATFLRTIIQRDTPFDHWVQGDTSAISAAAQRGFALFTGKARCVSCHTPPTFSDEKFHPSALNTIDPGRYEISHLLDDRNAFSTPPLRQIGMTAPYMHAGQKPTLSSVIRYYNTEFAQQSAEMGKHPLNLDKQEMDDLKAFLESLSGSMPAVTFPVLPVKPQ